MNTKAYLQILLSSVVLSALPLSAQTTLWDDSFSGTTLNNSWFSRGGSSVTQDDVLVLLPVSDNGFERGFLVTNNVQAGTTPGFRAKFKGSPAYNFFAHDLQLTYDDLSIPSDVTVGNLIFYSGVSGNLVNDSDGPRQGQPGAFLRVLQTASKLQLGVLDYTGGPRISYGTKNLNALPASIVFNLNASGWSVEITGTTFADGSTTTSGAWTNISSTTFATDAALVVGTYNEGVATWASGASRAPMTLGRFQATGRIHQPNK